MSTKLEDLKKTNLNRKLDDFCKTLNWLIFNNLNASSQKSHNETGLVISIEGKWGSGKTFFLDYYEKRLNLDGNKITNFIPKTRQNTIVSMNDSLLYTEQGQSNEIIIVKYDAFKNDHFEDPFISLTGEIVASVDNQNQRISLAKVSEALGKGFLYGAASLVPGFKEGLKAVEDTVNQQSTSPLNKSISAHQDFVNLQNSFKIALSTLGEKQATDDKASNTLPIKLIIIDELDRCRPDFAIKLLERIKHFFQVKNVVFILAIDRDALHSIINKVYGETYDAENYLSRFFDYSLAMPANEEFINAIIDKKALKIGDHLLRKFINYYQLQAREIFKLIDLLEKLQQIGSHLDILSFLATLKSHSHRKFRVITEFKPSFKNEIQLKAEFDKFINLASIDNNQKQPTALESDNDLKEILCCLFCYLAQEHDKNSYSPDYLNNIIRKVFPEHQATIQNTYGLLNSTMIPLLNSLVI